MTEMTEEDEEYYQEVVIIPERLLGDETTEKLLERFQAIDGIVNIILQGPNYLSRHLRVGEQKIHTTVKVGKIFIGISKESTIDEIKGVCDDILAFPYDLAVGRFSKTRPTVSDALGKSSYRDIGILDRK
ncbi:MAG TPA: hypothetical protein ENI32_04870 [Candidatus Syntrophoarchaeum butanivorans]|uniref:Methyl-coenzyme M reductase, protein D n=1 Tax=Candidatus Syntropharchaeum butanivorans TaxID=1839936 RepID=A0A1F2P4Q0_9EURY|nr:MAG: Methyl-coenzyme M reductase, protein D [Candidatus Syntrophoarchaeum butanivorans]HEC57197.1 hypothetical protein [Candidatus Syntrophoarchaeum butanivorans]